MQANVARASLEELRLDYEDFLRQRGLPLWRNDDPKRKELVALRCVDANEVSQWVKNACDRDKKSIASVKSIHSIYAAYSANAALVLIGVAVSLLDRQIAAQADAFEKEGGFTERLYRVRSSRKRQKE